MQQRYTLGILLTAWTLLAPAEGALISGEHDIAKDEDQLSIHGAEKKTSDVNCLGGCGGDPCGVYSPGERYILMEDDSSAPPCSKGGDGGGGGGGGGIPQEAAEALALAKAQRADSAAANLQTPNCDEDDADDEDDKKFAQEEAEIEEEEAALKAGVKLKEDTQSVVSPPTLPPAPSPQALKAKNDGNCAQMAAKQAAEAEAQVMIMQKITRFKKLKAKRYQGKALKAYKEASTVAAEMAKAKVAAAEAAAKACENAQKSTPKNKDNAQMKLEKAKEKIAEANKAKKQAEAMEAKAKTSVKDAAAKAAMTQQVKLKAEQDARAATAAVVKAAQEANDVMSKIKAYGDRASGCGCNGG